MKKGFTMIELLAVLVVMAIITTITVPSVARIIRKSESDSLIQQYENIRDAARIWSDEHLFENPSDGQPSIQLSLIDDLIAGGYVDNSVQNPKTDEDFDNLSVVISSYNNGLIYTIIENGVITNEDSNKVEGLPIVSLIGDDEINLSVGETYVDLGTYKDIGTGPIITYFNGEVSVSNVDTTAAGTTTIIYTVTNGDYTNSIARTVIVSN